MERPNHSPPEVIRHLCPVCMTGRPKPPVNTAWRRTWRQVVFISFTTLTGYHYPDQHRYPRHFFEDTLMDKEMIRQILAWLDAATDEELEHKQQELKRLIKRCVSDRKSDLKFALRLVEEEIVTRQDVMNFQRRGE